MADLYQILEPQQKYFDRKNYQTREDYKEALKNSTTIYVGNLSFFTTQDSLWELFSRAGKIKEIIMGINNEGHPCGFCFVIFQERESAIYAVQYISKTKLNDRIIRVDLDAGYKKDREKGRGNNGQQRRDDFRNTDDAERPTRKRVNTNYEKNYEKKQRKDDYKYGKYNHENHNRYNSGNRQQPQQQPQQQEPPQTSINNDVPEDY